MSSSSDHHENYSKRVSPKMVLQGPIRPPPLKVIKDSSCIIKKPAVLAAIDQDSHPHHDQLMISTGTRRCNLDHERRQRRPIVIHLKSPKVIHTRPQDFMVLVQQLTGKQSSTSVSSLLISSSSTTSGSRSSSTHDKCGGSSSSVPPNLIVDHHVHDDNYKEMIITNSKEEDDQYYNLLHHDQLSCSSGISSPRTSNILSPAYNSVLFGTTGFMS